MPNDEGLIIIPAKDAQRLGHNLQVTALNNRSLELELKVLARNYAESSKEWAVILEAAERLESR